MQSVGRNIVNAAQVSHETECNLSNLGIITSYYVTLAGVQQTVNISSGSAYNATVNVVLPPIGVGTTSALSIVAQSNVGELEALLLNVTGVITQRSTLEAMLNYPTTPVLAGAAINMSFNNNSEVQACNSNYSITLRDPTNMTMISSVTNAAFSAPSFTVGNNTVALSYTSALGTVYSEWPRVRLFLFAVIFIM
jgi:hypothetical protein